MAMNLLFLISLWNVTFRVSVQMGRGDVQAWWSFIVEVQASLHACDCDL